MRALLVALFIVSLPALGYAQPGGTCTSASTCTPIKKMACGTAGVNFPLCDADGLDRQEDLGTFWSRSYQTGIGPHSEPAYRITHIGTTDTVVEYYNMGLNWGVTLLTQGDCRYVRELLIINAPLTWNDNGGGRFGMKHWMVGEDGTNDVNRAIFNLRSNLAAQDPFGTHDGTHAMFRVQRNVTSEFHDVFDLVAGTAYYIQTQFCTSSTSVATDATIKIWVNNNTYASPTVQTVSPFNWPIAGMNVVRLGYYGESLGTTGNASYDILRFEYDDQFSTDWNGSAPTGASSTSTKYRYRFRADQHAARSPWGN